jgi:hypothetical protein
MEHQSSVTYGNGFKTDIEDLSGTGWGLNLILLLYMNPDMNGLLIISLIKISQICGFTKVSITQSLFVEYYYGKEAGFEYVRGIRKIFKTISQL